MRKPQSPQQSQPGLFQLPIQIPTWHTMSPEVKEQTMRLLSRLLRHYWKRRKGSIPAEAGNE